MPEPTQHHPTEHYRSAETTLSALASLRLHDLPEAAIVEALAALTHAVLATVPPRRARHREHASGRHGLTHGSSPRERWLHGED